MITHNVFPGGKKRVVTFSYDDGQVEDKRLVELFNKYNVKGSFHLNGNKYIGMSDAELAEISNTYKGHEISCHTLHHGWPAYMISPSVVTEVMEDRKILESIFNYPVIGMSYPSGSYDDNAINAMSACGIVYSRTIKSTLNFDLPESLDNTYKVGDTIGTVSYVLNGQTLNSGELVIKQLEILPEPAFSISSLMHLSTNKLFIIGGVVFIILLLFIFILRKKHLKNKYKKVGKFFK